MKAITFEQLIETFNFRSYNEYGASERQKEDTKIVRIYIDEERSDRWFEFGVYDYGVDTWGDIVQKCLSKEVCASYVSSISYNANLGVLEVYLQKDEEFYD